MIHVVHEGFLHALHRSKFAEFPESKWHNPFHGIDRFKNIRDFEEYARAYLWNDLHELDNQTLGCWCKPKECHGDVLKRLRQEQLDAKEIASLHPEHPAI